MTQTKKSKELALIEESLFSYAGDDRVISSHELAEELKKTEDSAFVLKTHIPTMDRVLKGVEAGELITVTGPTGEGKTTLLMTITGNMCQDNIQSLWFTLEVTPRQFIRKMTKSAGEEEGKLPLFYVPRQNTENTIKWIEERIIEAKVKYDVRAIFIDHIHMIFSLQRVQSNISLEIGDLVGKIKQIATAYNLVIFLIAHNKDNPTTPTAEPRKEDIRDSGMITRLSDTVMGIWRVPNNSELNENNRKKALQEGDTWSKVRIMKNRRSGDVGSFFMNHSEHKLVEIDSFGDEIR